MFTDFILRVGVVFVVVMCTWAKDLLPTTSSFFADSQFAAPNNTSFFAAMKNHMTKIANEKGLDGQNYQCADCASPIGKFS